MPNISKRAVQMPASPIRKLVPFSEDAKRRGVHVYHLNIGQPDLPTPPKALEALRSLDRRTLEYSHSAGLLSLRQTLAGYYARLGARILPDQIMVTCGASEALLFAFLACFNPGDEIIIMDPGYANYLGFAAEAGLKAVGVASSIDDAFSLPPVQEIEKVITPKTRGILICNPNNPTGYVYSTEEVEKLGTLVRKHNLFLIADEVYREFLYEGGPFKSSLSLEGLDENVVMIDSVSKRYSECGVRVGMLVTRNSEVLAAVMKFAQCRLSPPLLGQIVAEASIEGTEDYARACFDEYKSRRDFFIEGLNRIPGVFSPMPRGAFYTVASLPVEDAEDFARWCLTDFSCQPAPDAPPATVMMAPAAGFYSDPSMGRNQVRLAYVLCKEDLACALKCLEEALKAYNSGKL